MVHKLRILGRLPRTEDLILMEPDRTCKQSLLLAGQQVNNEVIEMSQQQRQTQFAMCLFYPRLLDWSCARSDRVPKFRTQKKARDKPRTFEIT